MPETQDFRTPFYPTSTLPTLGYLFTSGCVCSQMARFYFLSMFLRKQRSYLPLCSSRCPRDLFLMLLWFSSDASINISLMLTSLTPFSALLLQSALIDIFLWSRHWVLAQGRSLSLGEIHIYVFLLEYLIINHIKCLEGKEWISRRMKISTRILWERWEKPFLRPFKLRSGWWAEVQHLWRRRGRVLVIQALRWEETSVAAAWWAEEGGWDRRKAVDTESSSLLKLAIW